MSNTSSRALFDTERVVTGAFTGVAQNLGPPLFYSPAIMVFDNQSTVVVAVIVNGNTWKTFAAGEALVLDLRTNNGSAPDFSADLNTQFQVLATGGTGFFSLAIVAKRGTNNVSGVA